MLRVHRWLLVVLLGIALLVGAPPLAADPPTIVWRGDLLALTKARWADNDDSLAAARTWLLEQADQALEAGPFSVVDKQRLPPSGDKHDYYSFGPYWWPNPNTEDGLPYVRRDGQVNPESRGDDFDTVANSRMRRAVSTLALAGWLSDNPRYSQHAARLLRAWFLDEATRMNPHLNHGQAIPGITQGRGIGIIETRGFYECLDAAILLRDSEHWTAADHQGLRTWFAEYLTWLTTSKLGRDEDRTRNNHGTWYDAQVAAFALFVDQPELAKKVLAAAGQRRIVPQIQPDGRQPHELARTRSFLYSAMNLDGLTQLAELGRHVELDLWRVTPEAPRLRAATDFLLPYLAPTVDWPHKQLDPRQPDWLAIVLRRAERAYDDARYEQAFQRIPPAAGRHLAELLEPR